FCMLLRKHIQGGKINKIVQKQTERIVEFCIDSFNELGFPTTKKLIVEIMGKHSNITLTDSSNDRIIDSIKRISFDVNRYRQLLPGMTYVYPPSQDKLPFTEVSEQVFREIIGGSNQSVSKAVVSKIMGFSPFMAVSLCSSAGIDCERSGSLTCEEDIARLYREFADTVDKISKGEFSPSVWIDDENAPVDFYCFNHPDYSAAHNKISFNTIGEAEEYYYTRKKSTNRIRQKSSDLNKILTTLLDKLYLKKSRLSEDILKAEGAEIFKLKGELIFANIYSIKQGSSSVSLYNYYEDCMTEVALDPRLSPSDNGQKYFKKYTKQKTALIEKNIQLEENDREIKYIESVYQLLENASDYNDVEEIRQELINGGYIRRRGNASKAKSTAFPAHEHHTSDGFRILAGRNNKQNDILTLKTAGSKDIWFHTKDIPGTHVILFTEGKEPSEQALFEAASTAAYYSKGKMSENVPVDYTYVKYVKKPSGAKPGMVIFDHNKTLYVTPGLPPETDNEGK
ncbi:MAG: NFACT RNA binding domain-containing protein, partial [Bacillota bacterium]|nr:NFACT RNA binding domain-containing protein [Bacillota bacterium]